MTEFLRTMVAELEASVDNYTALKERAEITNAEKNKTRRRIELLRELLLLDGAEVPDVVLGQDS